MFGNTTGQLVPNPHASQCEPTSLQLDAANELDRLLANVQDEITLLEARLQGVLTPAQDAKPKPGDSSTAPWVLARTVAAIHTANSVAERLQQIRGRLVI